MKKEVKPERKQANLRYSTWERAMRLRLDLRLAEVSDVFDDALNALERQIKLKKSGVR